MVKVKRAEPNINLRVARARHSLTQDDVARHIGVDTPTYCRIERGGRDATPEQRKKLAKAFGVAEGELFPEVA